MSSVQELLHLVASEGRLSLGPKAQFENCVSETKLSGVGNYSSTISCLVAEFKSGNKTIKQPLFIKTNEPDKERRQTRLIDPQFCNEVFMYEKVVPFLIGKTECNIFPRYFYGSASLNQNPEKYVIVLEDLQRSGYKVCPQTLHLDFEHCELAFRKLGVFHALSFIVKQSNPREFNKLLEGIVETRLIEGARELYDCRHTTAVERAAGPLLGKGIYVEEIKKIMNKIQDSMKYLKDLLNVNEPLGVICHGDFNRNNLLYRYKNGKPIDVKIVDLATARYGSPMLDFSFFFQLNCSETMRKHHKEDFIRMYHESLSLAVSGLKVPSLQDFREEFRHKAVFGFLLCSSFKPFLMHSESIEHLPAKKDYSTEGTKHRVLTNGGTAATQEISALLQELLQNKCFWIIVRREPSTEFSLTEEQQLLQETAALLQELLQNK